MRKLQFFATICFLSILLVNCKKEKNEMQQTVDTNYEDSLKNGLWVYYDFNFNSFNDQSGNSRHMTGVNGMGFGYDIWGNNNNALDFDGIDDYAVIDAGKTFPEGDFTVTFLMMAKNNSGKIFQKADFNDAKGASFGFGFDQNPVTQNLQFYVANSNDVCTTLTEPSNSTILPVNKTIYPYAWYFVALQHVNGVENVYINGNLFATKNTPNKTFKNCTTAPFYLGMWWLQDRRHFSGKIDELRVYTRALSDKEIKYLFERLP